MFTGRLPWENIFLFCFTFPCSVHEPDTKARSLLFSNYYLSILTLSQRGSCVQSSCSICCTNNTKSGTENNNKKSGENGVETHRRSTPVGKFPSHGGPKTKGAKTRSTCEGITAQGLTYRAAFYQPSSSMCAVCECQGPGAVARKIDGKF